MDTDILQGERLRLRPIQRKDLQKLNEWKNKEDVYKNLGGGFLPVSIDIQEKWMDSLMDTTGKDKRFMIETNEKEAVGMVGLYNIAWIHRTCELGIFIGEKDKHNKGYGKEAYLLLEEFAKKYLDLRKIKATVVADNAPAVRMYQGLQFYKVGELVGERYIGGAYHNVILLEKFLDV